MSNDPHFRAVDADAVRNGFDPEEMFGSDALTWCGDTFQSGYAFREQLDTVIAPFLSPHARSVLNGGVQTVTDPAVDLLRGNEDGAEVIAFSREEFGELRASVGRAIESGDWRTYDNDDWATFAADRTEGDYYVLVEFV